MPSIKISKANTNNLKNVSVDIPLGKFVVVVGPSGSGKSSLVYDVIFHHSQKPGKSNDYQISTLPKTYAVGQKVHARPGLSLGETNQALLREAIKKLKKGDLLIVDEPCAGFSTTECRKILATLRQLVKQGISVLAVDHAPELIKGADYIIEFGPGSGHYGGQIVFAGSISKFKKSKTVTAQFVYQNKAKHFVFDREPNVPAKTMRKRKLSISHIKAPGLDDYDIEFPLSSLVCVHGPSGSGKSTLLDIAWSALYKGKSAWRIRQKWEGHYGQVKGKQNVRRSYLVEQRPISNNPASTPATYLKIWDSIRGHYASLPQAKKLKLSKTDFSYNVRSRSFGKRTLRVKYSGHNIRDLLDLTIDAAAEIFVDIPLIQRKLSFLQEVGLGYLVLGQPSGSLSGGEAQRVQLAKVLSKKLSDRIVYILDTPSRGLHLSDLPVLLKVLLTITDKNNTVLIADNKPEMIRYSDQAISLK